MRLLTIVGLVLCSTALDFHAQPATNTNSPARPISLEESIELALRQNLDVQISRINPEIARFNLSIAYADWEPAFSASGTHTFSSTPGGIDAQGRPFFATRSEADSFAANVGPGGTLGGLLPSGGTYNLSGTASDTIFTTLGPTN